MMLLSTNQLIQFYIANGAIELRKGMKVKLGLQCPPQSKSWELKHSVYSIHIPMLEEEVCVGGYRRLEKGQ